MQFSEEVSEAPPPPAIDSSVLDECLSLLQDADPTGVVSDPPRLLQLEGTALLVPSMDHY